MISVEAIIATFPFQAAMLMTVMGLAIGIVLHWAQQQLQPDTHTQVDAINQLLPQTQCAQCGYPGCRPYARAIHAGHATINLCPPGGETTLQQLAKLTGQPPAPLVSTSDPLVRAVIRESECIGCTLCIEACPVDAIVGAQQKTHTVIQGECTGCELCLPPCPVNCIDLVQSPAAVDIVPVAKAADDCVRCGDCVPACPRGLSPVQLYWDRSDMNRLETLRLDDCIECRLCDRVCPSELPLTNIFVQAKEQLQLERQRKKSARHAESRHAAREARLALKSQPVTGDKLPSPGDLLTRARGERRSRDNV